jgi:hypothetical protein
MLSGVRSQSPLSARIVMSRAKKTSSWLHEGLQLVVAGRHETKHREALLLLFAFRMSDVC